MRLCVCVCVCVRARARPQSPYWDLGQVRQGLTQGSFMMPGRILQISCHAQRTCPYMKPYTVASNQSTLATVAANSTTAHKGVCTSPLLNAPFWKGEGGKVRGKRSIFVTIRMTAGRQIIPDWGRLG